MTKFGPSSLSLKELFAEAALEAIVESHLTSKDIQALVIGNVLGDFAERQMNLAPLLADEIGLGAERAGHPGRRRLRFGLRGLSRCRHVGGLRVL